MTHIGFTGTRHGMSAAQLAGVRDVLDDDLAPTPWLSAP